MNKLLILAVIYKAKADDCVAITSLLQNEASITVPHKIVVYNNSPEISQENSRCHFLNGQGNDMLAKAYNAGLNMAKAEGYEWLMLIDQDTPFDGAYFEKVSLFIENPQGCDMAVPMIEVSGEIASPTYYHPVVGPYFITHPLTQIGRSEKYVTAFNSGSIIRVSAIDELGGFNEEYPLDALDNWYFHNLRKRGHYTYVMDCQLKQNLSLSTPNAMTLARYKSVMNSALRFAHSIGWVAVAGWRLRAIARCVVQLITPAKRRFLPLTLKYLWMDEL